MQALISQATASYLFFSFHPIHFLNGDLILTCGQGSFSGSVKQGDTDHSKRNNSEVPDL